MNPLGWPAAGADSDGDGATNLQEFLAGTNPMSRDSALRLDMARTAQGLWLNWNTEPGFVYQVQFSTNAVSWQTLGATRFAPGRPMPWRWAAVTCGCIESSECAEATPMRRLIPKLFTLAVAATLVVDASAFSLMGPFASWQTAAIGYNLPGDVGANDPFRGLPHHGPGVELRL